MIRIIGEKREHGLTVIMEGKGGDEMTARGMWKRRCWKDGKADDGYGHPNKISTGGVISVGKIMSGIVEGEMKRVEEKSYEQAVDKSVDKAEKNGVALPELPCDGRAVEKRGKRKGRKMKKSSEVSEKEREEIQAALGAESDAAGMDEVPSVSEAEEKGKKGRAMEHPKRKEIKV